MTKLSPSFSRRNLLLGTLQGAGFFLLSGCDKIFDALSRNDKFQSLLELAEHGNRRAQRLLTGRNQLAQEFSAKDISPKFRSNGNPPPITMDYAADAKNQWTKWQLEVSGFVHNRPASHSPSSKACLRAHRLRAMIASKAGASSANGKACGWKRL